LKQPFVFLTGIEKEKHQVYGSTYPMREGS